MQDKIRIVAGIISCSLMLAVYPATALADTYEDRLTGDWQGVRSSISDAGVALDIVNTGDYLINVEGGIEENDAYFNLLEVALSVDMETLANIPGGNAYFMLLGTHGRDAREFTGTINTPSSSAADEAFRVYQAWYEQSLLADRLAVLVGVYAVDTEFDARLTAGVFIDGGFGTGLDLSETGLNGPSILPVSSFGTRIRAALTDTVSLRVAVLDGVPGNPNDPASSAVRFDDGDGLLIMNEINYESMLPRFLRFGLGSWLYTTDFDDLVTIRPDGSPVQRNGSYGIYGFVEGAIITEADAPDQGLSGFFRVGTADEDVNQIGTYYAGGLVYTGLLPGRDDDVLGFGVSAGVNGDKFKTARRLAGTPVPDSEVALELTYQAQILPWLVLQPVLQYYIDPGSDAALDDSVVGGFRFSIAL